MSFYTVVKDEKIVRTEYNLDTGRVVTITMIEEDYNNLLKKIEEQETLIKNLQAELVRERK